MTTVAELNSSLTGRYRIARDLAAGGTTRIGTASSISSSPDALAWLGKYLGAVK
jgi:hypothetical protein